MQFDNPSGELSSLPIFQIQTFFFEASRSAAHLDASDSA